MGGGAGDLALTYRLREGRQDAEVSLGEHLLRDGERVVAVTSEKAYAVWHLRPDGVWRADPRGGESLLRYLPPQLVDGLHWRQRSGDTDVWFALRHIPDGWELAVLNRGERTVFHFAAGRGPV